MGTNLRDKFPLLFYTTSFPSSHFPCFSLLRFLNIFDSYSLFMQYSGLSSFIDSLEKSEELLRIKTYADPVLEITEITDRVTKSGGKALLFENNGTAFPLLINAYGSDKRMAMAIGNKILKRL
ncbi:MAG TPA: UbiD family decarboxylase [Bacteroidales bacterium]|nr:UbiD family decarboxylase [Bacteroidales bacterium]